MSAVAVRGATIGFAPGSGWSWASGEVTGSLGAAGHAAAAAGVATEADIPGLASELVRKQYKASGFEDVPGVVAAAVVHVDVPTLAPGVAIAGQRVVLADTTGTFRVTVSPALNTSGAVPIPDTVISKSGTWSIRSAGQESVSCAR